MLPAMFGCWSEVVKSKSSFENDLHNELIIPIINKNNKFFTNFGVNFATFEVN